MVKMQASMTEYVKWLTRRSESIVDKEKGVPASVLGRTMIAHGEDFDNDSEFGNCLIGMLHLIHRGDGKGKKNKERHRLTRLSSNGSGQRAIGQHPGTIRPGIHHPMA